MTIKVTHLNAEDHVVMVVEELVKFFTYDDGEDLLTTWYGDTVLTKDVKELLNRAGFELEVR